MATLEFWFEYGSTYTYLTVARIGRAAREAGIAVEWRPFLLMPIMIEQGLTQGPFLAFPNKLAYMWRDLERRAGELGMPYRKPSRYPPAETLTSARLGVLGAREGWVQAFTERAFELHWTQDLMLGSADNLVESLRAAGQDRSAIERANSPEIKSLLREQTESARQRGIFGSPSFFVREELFWGDDRLDQALAAARAS